MPLDESDVLLIAALSLGRPSEAAAKFAGVTTASAKKRIKANAEVYSRTTERIGEEMKRVISEEIEKQLGSLKAKSRKIKEQVLNSAINDPLNADAVAAAIRVASKVDDGDTVAASGGVLVFNPQKVHKLAHETVDLAASETFVERWLPPEALRGAGA